MIIKFHGGPVFFIQPRIGINGKVFPLIKFRTMIPNSEMLIFEIINKNDELYKEWYANYRLQDDPRVTKFGKFLRKSKIDEIPQFLNVLIGQMSVVGPRPLTQEEFEKKFKSSDHITAYQSVLPGITGRWQTSDEVDFDNRILLEVGYISKVGFVRDAKIMFLTVKKILNNIF